jgi:hypothetical protein
MPSRQTSSDDKSASVSSSERAGLDKEVVSAALLDGAQLITAKGNIITDDGVVISTQESDASLSTNVFADPEVKAYYINVYEKAK